MSGCGFELHDEGQQIFVSGSECENESEERSSSGDLSQYLLADGEIGCHSHSPREENEDLQLGIVQIEGGVAIGSVHVDPDRLVLLNQFMQGLGPVVELADQKSDFIFVVCGVDGKGMEFPLVDFRGVEEEELTLFVGDSLPVLRDHYLRVFSEVLELLLGKHTAVVGQENKPQEVVEPNPEDSEGEDFGGVVKEGEYEQPNVQYSVSHHEDVEVHLVELEKEPSGDDQKEKHSGEDSSQESLIRQGHGVNGDFSVDVDEEQREDEIAPNFVQFDLGFQRNPS